MTITLNSINKTTIKCNNMAMKLPAGCHLQIINVTSHRVMHSLWRPGTIIKSRRNTCNALWGVVVETWDPGIVLLPERH